MRADRLFIAASDDSGERPLLADADVDYNGAGLGASHQTGWTGLVAKLIELSGVLDPKPVLERVRRARSKRAPDTSAGCSTRSAPWQCHIFHMRAL